MTTREIKVGCPPVVYPGRPADLKHFSAQRWRGRNDRWVSFETVKEIKYKRGTSVKTLPGSKNP